MENTNSGNNSDCALKRTKKGWVYKGGNPKCGFRLGPPCKKRMLALLTEIS